MLPRVGSGPPRHVSWYSYKKGFVSRGLPSGIKPQVERQLRLLVVKPLTGVKGLVMGIIGLVMGSGLVGIAIVGEVVELIGAEVTRLVGKEPRVLLTKRRTSPRHLVPNLLWEVPR